MSIQDRRRRMRDKQNKQRYEQRLQQEINEKMIAEEKESREGFGLNRENKVADLTPWNAVYRLRKGRNDILYRKPTA